MYAGYPSVHITPFVYLFYTLDYNHFHLQIYLHIHICIAICFHIYTFIPVVLNIHVDTLRVFSV